MPQEGRMKRLALVLALAVLLLAIPGAAFAQKSWDGLVHKGDFAAYVGIGFGWGFTIVPGVEWAFADVKVGDTVPLAFGLAGKGMINFYPGFWTSYGVGALVTAHLGLKGPGHPRVLPEPGLLHRRRHRLFLLQRKRSSMERARRLRHHRRRGLLHQRQMGRVPGRHLLGLQLRRHHRGSLHFLTFLPPGRGSGFRPGGIS